MKLKLDAIYGEMSGMLEGRVDRNAPIPEFLTPQRVLEIYVKSVKAHATKLNEVWQKSTERCDWGYFNQVVGSVELVAVK
mgnify:FL=1